MLLRSGPGPGPGARTWQLCSCSRRLRLDAGLRIKALHVPKGPSVDQNHLLLLQGRCPEARAGSRHLPRSARRDLHRRLAMREIAGRSSLVVFLLSLIRSTAVTSFISAASPRAWFVTVFYCRAWRDAWRRALCCLQRGWTRLEARAARGSPPKTTSVVHDYPHPFCQEPSRA